MSLISVDEALQRLLKDVSALDWEDVALKNANGRVLASPLEARRTQPPFAASAMDGYAVKALDIATLPVSLKVIGEAPAGHGFAGSVRAGEAVRIFTGAPLPEGADTIVIQENTNRRDGAVEILQATAKGAYVRPAGLDFEQDQILLPGNIRLGYREVSLAAAMNHPVLRVIRRPRVAVLATGDELVLPGETPGRDQIIASNSFGIAALAESGGAEVIDLGIAVDTRQALAEKIQAAADVKADILVTLGGASVGDHDLVQDALGIAGMDIAFWKIAMRPGKPLMAGQIGPMRVLGLPGNPVSSLVCGLLFLKPLLAALQGLSPKPRLAETAILGKPVTANDLREDYLRASLTISPDGEPVVDPFDLQDSSMLATFAKADALIVRPANAGPLSAGATVPIIRLSNQ